MRAALDQVGVRLHGALLGVDRRAAPEAPYCSSFQGGPMTSCDFSRLGYGAKEFSGVSEKRLPAAHHFSNFSRQAAASAKGRSTAVEAGLSSFRKVLSEAPVSTPVSPTSQGRS